MFMKTPEMTITDETLPAMRKNFIFAPELLPKDESVEVHNEMINSNLRVRVYKPKKEMKEYPALLWIHGGGHIIGTPEQDEALMLDHCRS